MSKIELGRLYVRHMLGSHVKSVLHMIQSPGGTVGGTPAAAVLGGAIVTTSSGLEVLFPRLLVFSSATESWATNSIKTKKQTNSNDQNLENTVFYNLAG